MNLPTPPLSSVDAPTLNAAIRATSGAVDAALSVVSLAMDAASEARQISPDELRPLANDANDKIQRAPVMLVSAGGRDPELPNSRPIPLDQLRTPDTELLLSLLERAQAVAERVDAARGRSLADDVPLMPGESRGTDLAETISEIALRVRVEVLGPGGRD